MRLQKVIFRRQANSSCLGISSIFRLFFLLFLLPACQPLQYSSLEFASSGSEDGLSPFSLSGQDEFHDFFMSDKVDMVFVLDTELDMKGFYTQSLFSDDFLSRFQSYDWKFAYTDMSVDMSKFSKKSKKRKEQAAKEEESCNWFSNLLMTAAGLYSTVPVVAGFGIERLWHCVENLDFDEEQPEGTMGVFADGAFLPLEYKGKKLKLKQLTPSTEKYNEIFDNSLRIENAEKQPGFDAPELRRDVPSHPFLAIASSLMKGREPLIGSSPFFRKDSLIVYVPVTIRDSRIKITARQFKQGLKNYFGSQDRIKIIPVTLHPESSFMCKLSLETDSNPPANLIKLAKQLGNNSLDICSSSLADELFAEITKFLYPQGLISEIDQEL